MKIQCDSCDKEEASVFCCSDDAALCGPCDRQVHRANKLAGKHHRFSLIHPSVEQTQLCDICQERRGMVFCREDRAILCRDCDDSIHKANEHTEKHNRFLLSGVKLSPLEPSFSYQTSTSSNGSSYSYNINAGTSESGTEEINRTWMHDDQYHMAFESACRTENYNCQSQDYGITSVSTSSISEYLMETLPGWHVEEFLDPSSSQYSLYDKGTNDYVTLPHIDNNFEEFLGPTSSQDVVPQASRLSHSHLYQTGQFNLGPVIVKSENENNSKKGGKKWSRDGSAVVDKSASTKKSKRFW
ncbi:B-box zinc finger protein 20 [Heracleum sosnowskyi]|uniref:B-box zinc finger protein 20 n=1 Tax=Heracleum sosnowskyi TaxID=360622 RepID=A0AAD8MEU8_9APIA|nr:B-box zinc finger protein 20 [Heracleum sosnowskyi]